MSPAKPRSPEKRSCVCASELPPLAPPALRPCGGGERERRGGLAGETWGALGESCSNEVQKRTAVVSSSGNTKSESSMNGAKKSAVGMSASMSVGTADEACARATWNRRYGSNAGLAPAAARKTRCVSAQRKIGGRAHRCRRRAAGVDVGERDAEHSGRLDGRR